MIKVGMLWFDDSPQRPLESKVAQAVEHYVLKYGHRPNICLVSPGSRPPEPSDSSPIQIVIAPDILPHHLLLGVNQDPAPKH